jgi:hypothetical protein
MGARLVDDDPVVVEDPAAAPLLESLGALRICQVTTAAMRIPTTTAADSVSVLSRRGRRAPGDGGLRLECAARRIG